MGPDLVLNVSQSASGQAWAWRTDDEDQIAQIARANNIPFLQARLLAGRGVESDEVAQFLKPTLRHYMPDPSSLSDMDKAASAIVDAVQDKKKITVFADYDVDGATSAAQLIRWGRHFGAEFGLYVPDRVEEGYGPNIEAFRQLKQDGNDLVITVDCGAAAHEPLREAAELDLPIIVIDHHLMQGEDMPPALALVNPNREDDQSGLGHLAAAGVSFMLLAALNREARRRGIGDGPNLLDLLGLTALGTVCDVVPLRGLNRAITYQGMRALSKDNIVGIRALADVAGVQPPFSNYHAGFVLGPRINAGGRIGQSTMGAELLTTEDAQLAYSHASELDRVNTERKRIQDDIIRESLDQISSSIDPDDNGPIVSAMEGWHPGIIGIVAGRLKDRFSRPAIVIGIDDGIGKGSGRSIEGVNLGDAIVAAREAGLVTAGGGHAMAAGLTLPADNIEKFQEFMRSSLSEDIAAARSSQALRVDGLITPKAVGLQLVEQIEAVGPFGAGLPQPAFVLADMKVEFAKRLNGGHVKCSFSDAAGQRVDGICFRADERGFDEILLDPRNPVLHIAVRVVKNSWQGRERADIHIIDLAHA